MSASKSLPKSVAVTIFEGTDQERVVQVNKLKLGRAAQLALAFQSLPERLKGIVEMPEIQELFGSQNDDVSLTEIAAQLLRFLPDVLAVASDSVIGILAVGTGLDREELEEVGLDEGLALLEAVLTVNDLNRIQQTTKNVLGRLGIDLSKALRTPMELTPTNGSKT